MFYHQSFLACCASDLKFEPRPDSPQPSFITTTLSSRAFPTPHCSHSCSVDEPAPSFPSSLISYGWVGCEYLWSLVKRYSTQLRADVSDEMGAIEKFLPALRIVSIVMSPEREQRNILIRLRAIFLSLWITSTLTKMRVSGEAMVGVNLGFMGDSFPNVSTTVDLLNDLHAGAVRLYDSNPAILGALSNTPLAVTVSVRNDELADMATSPSAADTWVETHVAPFYPATKITYIAVGNEVLHEGTVEMDGQHLTPALKNIYNALVAQNLHDAIKVISPLSGEILGSSWPPAAGTFNRVQYVVPLLQFLQDTGSTFFINLYPYYAHIANNLDISFEFATFQRTTSAFLDPLSLLPYSNLFESMLDAAYNAMAHLGFPDLPLAVGETGWPTAGGHAATVENAELFNRNLVQYVFNKGTPQRPDVRVPVFIFALFNENLKPGPESERNWGILNADGTPVYPTDLAGGSADG